MIDQVRVGRSQSTASRQSRPERSSKQARWLLLRNPQNLKTPDNRSAWRICWRQPSVDDGLLDES
nr:hypothetical protein [Pseudomonas baetica]